jgi:16S rRNA (cytidine1402-2'-O)-methyltransferase
VSEPKLILCANHIGNIHDLPIRTKHALDSVEIVLAEDTRTIGRLCKEIGVSASLMSYYDQNEIKRVTEIDTLINDRKATQFALISESGMPCVSDPGYRIVKYFQDKGYQVTAIPGPSACITALALSGFPCDQFSFVGFWPRKKGKQAQMVERVVNNGETLIFYESPKRILKTIETLSLATEEISLFLAKELTKPFERFWRGSPSEVLKQLKSASQKGEFVGVLTTL